MAANRDEMAGRPWQSPARHWPDRFDVVAGRDELADGTWLGVNDNGVVAGVLNRRHTLGALPGCRSRGELPLEALDHATAADAAEALAYLDPGAYRPFNLVVADRQDGFLVQAAGGGNGSAGVTVSPLPPGLSMITARGLNDPASPRVALHLPRLLAARPPDPDEGDWSSWQSIMASREFEGSDAGGAMTVVTDGLFGTVSSSLIALPAVGRFGIAPIWLFAAGRPGDVSYQPVGF